MDPFETSHFSNDALLHNLRLLAAHDCRTTAVMLTRIAEVEERKLFLQEGYPSMHAYCVRELHFSEGVAYKRIEAARTTRRFPGVLVALAEGRLHLRAVQMLAPYLTSANADELVAAATHKTRFELQQLLAERFPHSDLPESLQAITARPAPTAVAVPPGRAAAPIGSGSNSVTIPGQYDHALALDPARLAAPEQVEASAPRGRVTPLSPQRYAFQCTFDQETHDLLQDVRALMSHDVPSGEAALVIKGALKLAKAELMKRKAAATDRPGPSRPSTSARHIPAAVKRAVRKRDGGRCTFVSDDGRRCAGHVGVRPPGAGGARGRGDGGERAAHVPRAQPACGGARLRARLHGLQAAEGPAAQWMMGRMRPGEPPGAVCRQPAASPRRSPRVCVSPASSRGRSRVGRVPPTSGGRASCAEG